MRRAERPSDCRECWPAGIDFDPYAEFGAGPDVVADVQADLVSAFWLPRYRLGMSDATALITECGEELILPGGHVATVLRRLGYEAEAAAFLIWNIANSRSKDKRRKAGRASAVSQKASMGN